MLEDQRKPEIAFTLLLILAFVAASCVSLALVAQRYEAFYFYFDLSAASSAVLAVLIACAAAPLFAFSRFSFGWGAGFYLYTTAVGYVWLSYFSPLHYDHDLARVSIMASVVAFLLPAMLITGPWLPKLFLPARAHNRLLLGILAISGLTVGFCSTYGFHIVGLQDIHSFRSELNYPTWLNYLINICITTLLPYAFASYIQKRNLILAAGALIIGLLFYPVTFSKTALAAPVWIVFLAIFSRWFSARSSTILSLLVPMILGFLSYYLTERPVAFGVINFRMLAIPASAIDLYSQFFAQNPLTGFCQISFLKSVMGCPYFDQLSVVMQDAYHLGNYNASLLATEGIASVGPVGAPITALACGIIVAFGNLCSGLLPSRFVLISSSVLVQAVLNVPFSTTILTHGAIILFALWYLTPPD